MARRLSVFEGDFPPGTTRLEDSTGSHIVLSPQPSADPNQPLNWSTFRKAVHMTILSFYAMMVFAILCISTPLWQDFNEELGLSYTVLNYSYAANMAALSVGCIILVPVALWLGRRPIYIFTSVLMLVSAIWQAKMRTAGDAYGTMIVAGIAGAVNETLFQVTVSDLFFVHQRGTMNGIYLIVVLIGNYFGPVAGGYVAASQGWPWAFWYCTIFMGVVTIVMIFFLEETKYNAPIVDGVSILNAAVDAEQDNKQATKDTGVASSAHSSISSTETPTATDTQMRRSVQIDTTFAMKTYRQRHAWWTLDTNPSKSNSFWLHVYQPFQILFTFPAVMFTALQYGWAIAMLAILAVTQATLYPFEPYNFSTIGVGNMNIPPAIGAILGSLFGGPVIDWFIVKVAKRRNGIYEPETRLWLFTIPAVCMPIGALMYGLTIAKGMPWIINAIGAGFIGAAIGGCGDSSLTYLQDSYQHILGDALISVVFVRNIISTGLVFAITPWMTNMGVYNMFVLCGVLAVVIALTVVPMIIWGRKWRGALKGRYQYYASRQYA